MNDGCVQFSKNSWHYKAVNYVFRDKVQHYDGAPKQINLCPYMRAVVASMLSIIFVAGWRKLPYGIQDNAWLVQAELIFFAIIIVASASLGYLDDQNKDILPPFEHLVAYGFFGGNLVGVVGGACVAGAWRLKDHLDAKPKTEHKTRGLIKTYVASKHDKICPCVEFEDD